MAKDMEKEKVNVEFTEEEANAINWAIEMMAYYGSTNPFWSFPCHTVNVSSDVNKLTLDEINAIIDVAGEEDYAGAYTWGEENNPYSYGQAFKKLNNAAFSFVR